MTILWIWLAFNIGMCGEMGIFNSETTTGKIGWLIAMMLAYGIVLTLALIYK